MSGPQTRIPMSGVIITLNEEANLARCIKSMDFLSEVVVVDSGSTDQTVAIARSLGARVLEHAWMGFGPQKRFAVEQAVNDWVLCLDADEEISLQLKREIEKKFSELNPRVGYRLPRMSHYLGNWIHYGGWYPDRQLRLFHRKHSQWNLQTIHEKVESLQTAELKSEIFHYVFSGVSEQVQTNDRYSSLQAEKAFQSGLRFSYFYLVTKPWIKFLECYLLKRGILDGFPGFVIAVNAAHSVFIRWVKIWELEKGLRKVRSK